MAKTRFLRFLTMMDSTVKTCVIREADGIVNMCDCKNIDLFEKSNYLFYIIDGIGHNPESLEKGDVINPNSNNKYQGYQPWISIYKSKFDASFFEKKNNLYDLLAGVISINIKIKNDFFQSVKNNLSENIDTYIKKDKYSDSDKIKIGFDEMFLLNLFKDIISCPYN